MTICPLILPIGRSLIRLTIPEGSPVQSIAAWPFARDRTSPEVVRVRHRSEPWSRATRRGIEGPQLAHSDVHQAVDVLHRAGDLEERLRVNHCRRRMPRPIQSPGSS